MDRDATYASTTCLSTLGSCGDFNIMRFSDEKVGGRLSFL